MLTYSKFVHENYSHLSYNQDTDEFYLHL